MPTHLLRALYVRDRWGIIATDPPRALGVTTVTEEQRLELTTDWHSCWAWLSELDVTDDRLLDRPDELAQGSQCPPPIHALLAESAEEVSSWTTRWRTTFRDEIATGSTGVEQKLARLVARGGNGRPLVVRVLPLDGQWLTWVGPHDAARLAATEGRPSQVRAVRRHGTGGAVLEVTDQGRAPGCHPSGHAADRAARLDVLRSVGSGARSTAMLP
jgi:hypothetical protein